MEKGSQDVIVNEQENIIIDQTTNEHSMDLMNKQKRNTNNSRLNSVVIQGN